MAESALIGRRRGLSARTQERLAGWAFALPGVLALAGFVLVPVLTAVALAFTDYPLLSPPVWNNFANVTRLFRDKLLATVYRNSALITAGTVFFNNLIGLATAIGVNRKMPKALSYFFRTAFFFPFMTTTATLAMVWRMFMATDMGILNWMLGQIGLDPIPWLSSAVWAIRSVIIYDVWKSFGFLMILYLAGLQGIPESLYEAAEIDGANRWQSIRHVTLPLITPTAFMCLIISSIGAFQIFDNAYVLTGGGPGSASMTIVMYIYEISFRRFEMGYASLVALSLMAVLVGLTLLQFWAGRRWVHYE
ncbi:MAG: sugar ABC transporter permease [Anaerolineales bacterium]|nr:sugar ABC transporter permease [Anaerolineales bacterium]